MTYSNHRVDPDLVAEVTRFFARRSDHETVARAEVVGLIPELWTQTEELGLPLVGIDELNGGSGGTFADALAILRAAGAHAAPLPLAETHLAAWLLSGAGLDVPAGPLAVAPVNAVDTLTVSDGRVRGELYAVPWASAATTIVALADSGEGALVVAVRATDADFRAGRDLAGQPRDTVVVDAEAIAVAPSGVDLRRFLLRAGLVRAAQMAGALDAIADLTRAYTAERVQFGKPIGTFQAVQQHVVTLAQSAAITALCVDRAAAASLSGDADFESAAAKLVADRSAVLAVRAAHQAHGAIGLTREYRLQQFTRRLNSWRLEFGTEKELSARLGVAASSVGSLAGIITGPDTTMEV